MYLLDLTRRDPFENVALDDALVEEADAGALGEVLRFWESPVPFVVLGAGSPSKGDVDVARCEGDGIPVVRRSSGGGTVLQGPGCLNYALVLDREAREKLRTIDGTNRTVLSSVGRALQAQGILAEQEGVSDLRSDAYKFSGNAQRRKRRYLLFHGTLLYDFDLSLVARYLREPARRPEWRGERTHDSFVRNIPADPSRFRHDLADLWDARQELSLWPEAKMRQLVDSKFSRPDWIFGL